MTQTKLQAGQEHEERIRCMNCGKSVSTPVPKDTLVRAWVECPECIEKSALTGSAGASSEPPSDEHRGIYEKYRVERLNDPTGKHKGCNFFVLDLVHDKFAIPALKAYAKACKKEFPQLAKDIQWAISLASGPKGEFFPTSISVAVALKMEHER
jgi:hypothetical protein